MGEWRVEGGWLKITAEELLDQMQRFSESNHKNNFPHIMPLIEDRSLNYSRSIVYREHISSSLFSVHLSISPHFICLILIRPPPPSEYTTSSSTAGEFVGGQAISDVKYVCIIYDT